MARGQQVYGVIHIGSVALSMCIADYRGAEGLRLPEKARRQADFGEEVFTTGELSFTSIRQMCRILNGFRRILADYGVREVFVYATAVLREAKNRRLILDLIEVHTGLHVEVLDMPQEIFYKHFALHRQLSDRMGVELTGNDAATLFVDITSGAVGFTVWREDRLCYQQNVHIGTLRVLESFGRNQRDNRDFPQVLDEYLRSMLAPIWPVLERYPVRYLVLSGRESRLVAQLLGIPMTQELVIVQPEHFLRAFNEVHDKTATGLQHHYGIDDAGAQKLLPTLHLYAEILAHIRAEHLIMMSTTFLYGAAMYAGAVRYRDPALAELREQHRELAKEMALRYGGNILHLETVAEYATLLMRALRPIHGLDERDSDLLWLAAVLHRTGRYVNLRRNNEHTYHIIMGTDLFGLSDPEKEVVATVAYYNYKGRPSDEDEPFRRLPEQAKMRVLKLVAILRLAVAMDKGESNKLHRVEAVLRRDALAVSYESPANTLLEEWTFAAETAVFRDVFGMNAELERRMP